MSSIAPRPTYIYILVDPRDKRVRYVGKSDNPQRRFRRHLTEVGRTHRHNWLRQLRSVGLEPILEVIEEIELSQWVERESYWIQLYRNQGHDLTNQCSGGNGAPGLSPSQETRAKISISVKKQWELNPRQLSLAHRQAVGRAHKGRKRPPETGQRISAAKTGRHIQVSSERRAKYDAMRGKPAIAFTPEIRQKISEALKCEGNGQAKLTMEKAREIRLRYAKGDVSLNQLAKEYGVDARQINRIVRNEAWIE